MTTDRGFRFIGFISWTCFHSFAGVCIVAHKHSLHSRAGGEVYMHVFMRRAQGRIVEVTVPGDLTTLAVDRVWYDVIARCLR